MYVINHREAHNAIWSHLRALVPSRYHDGGALAEAVLRRLLRSAPPTMPDGYARPTPKPIHKSDLLSAATGIIAHLYAQAWPSVHPNANRANAYRLARAAFNRLHAAGVVGYRSHHPLVIRNA